MSRPADGGFVHRTRSLRVVFGVGTTATAGEELDRLGIRRALAIATPRGAEAASDLVEALGSRVAGVFSGARLHVPEEVARSALDEAHRVGADGLVAPGGGSAIGAAKAVAVDTGLPIVALPTTYSGSEMTAIWGVTGKEGKLTGRDERAGPRTVIYDPARTLDLPAETSAASGMNALAHGVEALYAHDGSPLSGLLSEEGVGALARALPRVARQPRDLAARTEALYGAHLTGWALDLASMGLHHKLCHVLGGTFNLPHALVHAILLPHVAAFNEPAAPAAMARVARALEADRAPRGLHELNRAVGIEVTLRDLGLEADDLDRAAALATGGGYPNPRPPDRNDLRNILQAAWEGRPPG